ncbi:methyl-CpG binding domain-containing protein 4 [Nannizzia gypsea CBS 118893]|uniref:Methyl-CpG binding domain-containing protein 4 n=1 Tax=Arthroderma gypseum (strain ATCC MYA-4604 / CBS 118893) TaxID=535722 RepID=E4UNJ2_ARTGP|nr:methyl-CpG binding domain-containing protein 4 [Nannizzia gypsea CBS 118893]EFQ99600.1 methyl-CpG binding domain-containing protein 4 [Nannizzia gypsea CBS 118893]
MAKSQKTSPYFKRKRPDITSCIPFPPISAVSFGLIQEKLAHEPFRLLVATIFLNRTRGEVAIPVLYSVFEHYPTIESLANADFDELVSLIRRLGFQNSRAKKCIALAKAWIANAPEPGKRYRKLHYPNKSDGSDIKCGEVLTDDDTRVAWEVGHLPGIGPYAIDSWRIFCRDELRGLATDWNGAGTSEGFLPEWKSVHPKDKELCAYLAWMWLRDGWIWDPQTGTKIATNRRILRAVRDGGLVLHKSSGKWVLDLTAAGETSLSIEVGAAKFVNTI